MATVDVIKPNDRGVQQRKRTDCACARLFKRPAPPLSHDVNIIRVSSWVSIASVVAFGFPNLPAFKYCLPRPTTPVALKCRNPTR